MIDLESRLAQRLAAIRDQVSAAAWRSGRDLSEVQLVAVTKTQELEAIEAAWDIGLRDFGENRVEEAEGKITAARHALHGDVTWHMIGHVQSRKTARVVELFNWVHSIDRFKIARKISEALVEAERSIDALLEVNLSGEQTKSGFDLCDWPDNPIQQDLFVREVEQMAGLPNLRLRGLMTIAPYTDDPETVRPIFKRARELRDVLRRRFPEVGWEHLSMGMSGDFGIAVEEGATIIRLGTALFGPRT